MIPSTVVISAITAFIATVEKRALFYLHSESLAGFQSRHQGFLRWHNHFLPPACLNRPQFPQSERIERQALPLGCLIAIRCFGSRNAHK